MDAPILISVLIITLNLHKKTKKNSCHIHFNNMYNIRLLTDSLKDSDAGQSTIIFFNTFCIFYIYCSIFKNVNINPMFLSLLKDSE